MLNIMKSNNIKQLFYLYIFSYLPFAVLSQIGTLDQSFEPKANNAGAIYGVSKLLMKSDGKILVAGQFSQYNGESGSKLVQINQDGSKNSNFLVGNFIGNAVYACEQQTDGKIIFGGDFTTYNGLNSTRILRLNSNGSKDTTFKIGSGPDGSIRSIHIQKDGKIIVAGKFSFFNNVYVLGIIRLNPDGTRDASFSAGSGIRDFGEVECIQSLSDGKILIGGDFTLYNGVKVGHIIRLNSDGTRDNSFNIGTGAGFPVRSIVVQSDGKIIVGGSFSDFNGKSVGRIIRLNPDGTKDITFNVGTGFNSDVYSLMLLPNNKIIVGGLFSSFNGIAVKRVIVLQENGSVDNNFVVPDKLFSIRSFLLLPNNKILAGGSISSQGVNISSIFCFNSDGTEDINYNKHGGISGISNIHVNSIGVQNDDKILLGGEFNSYNGVTKNNLVRINSDGSLDNTFDIGIGPNKPLKSVLCQSNGKIIVGGNFQSFNNISANSIIRLNNDGTKDNTFNVGSGTDGVISSIIEQPDGKIIVGGVFTSFNGEVKTAINRLNHDGSRDTSFKAGAKLANGVSAIALQLDGKIVIGGEFNFYGSTISEKLIRLNTDGTRDASFNIQIGANAEIKTIAIQNDGKILIGGLFTKYKNNDVNYIARINTDGTLDSTFKTGIGFNSFVNSIEIINNSKILVGGNFTIFNGQKAHYYAQLNFDGTIDISNNLPDQLDGQVKKIFIQPDGNILLGGYYTSFNGIGRNRIARLLGDIPTSTPSHSKVYSNLFPNPSRGIFTLTLSTTPTNILIFDQTGKLIKLQKTTTSNCTIDLSNFENGIYYIQILYSQSSETLKAIINK